MPFWFGFRQVKPSPPGNWVAYGPYKGRDSAMAAYEREKLAPDAQVSPLFEAESQMAADRFVRGTNPN